MVMKLDEIMLCEVLLYNKSVSVTSQRVHVSVLRCAIKAGNERWEITEFADGIDRNSIDVIPESFGILA